ncbi:MAG: glutathione S-transferase [Comamonadaceae bacterium]|jgi:glutathione S-transferase|uniref:Glutathione S-transferase n=1 Tax=Hydrogenophaga borbori TaxID=2294117 RepID=A0A372EKL6_9BURK|nr:MULTISPECIES: glutathione S-transferase [Hydrogenophaga]NCT99635.1 glutathione S-transferase [Comamonadaceae bacterium]RFP79652.1 glutathione S-transferase [Hydrogenophaga borbori]WQB84120.1 glutathione S-transferase [Hydrogenophaga sp. SNF1]
MSAEQGLHLWGRLSSINVRKVVLCAQWLGLELPRTDAGLSHGVVDTPAYRALNPNGLVPLLRDGDFTLWESNAILRYLCERQGRGMPTDLRTRADTNRWLDWQQTTLNRAGSPAFTQWIRTPAERRDLAAIEASVRAAEPLFERLDAHLAQRPWMAGDEPTAADFPIACEIHRWFGLPQPRPAWPHLERWYAGWLAMPCSRGVLDLPLA